MCCATVWSIATSARTTSRRWTARKSPRISSAAFRTSAIASSFTRLRRKVSFQAKLRYCARVRHRPHRRVEGQQVPQAHHRLRALGDVVDDLGLKRVDEPDQRGCEGQAVGGHSKWRRYMLGGPPAAENDEQQEASEREA